MPAFKLPTYSSPIYKAEKRADEVLTYSIDVSGELDQDEIIVQVQEPLYINTITQYRSRKGKYLEVTIPSSVIEGASPTQESKCTIRYSTNKGNIRIASFIIKAYR